MKKNDLKGPRFSIRHWRISFILGSGIAGFNCTSRDNSYLWTAQCPWQARFPAFPGLHWKDREWLAGESPLPFGWFCASAERKMLLPTRFPTLGTPLVSGRWLTEDCFPWSQTGFLLESRRRNSRVSLAQWTKARLEARRPGWRPPKPGWMPQGLAGGPQKWLWGLARSLEAWHPWPGINPLKPGSSSQRPCSRPFEAWLGVRARPHWGDGCMYIQAYVCTNSPVVYGITPFGAAAQKARNYDNHGREMEVKTDKNDI